MCCRRSAGSACSRCSYPTTSSRRRDVTICTTNLYKITFDRNNLSRAIPSSPTRPGLAHLVVWRALMPHLDRLRPSEEDMKGSPTSSSPPPQRARAPLTTHRDADCRAHRISGVIPRGDTDTAAWA
jgi:hypothetical protein